MAEGRLLEVEKDAIRIQTKRFRDFEEELAYNKSKHKEDVSAGNPAPGTGFNAPSTLDKEGK